MDNLFFIVGAQRCGTTYLYNILDSHPDIYMAKPLKPEPKFFLNKRLSKQKIEAYLNKYFTSQLECKRYKAFGEKSTSYFEYAYVGENIKKFFPNAKIIIIFRNPSDRAISHYFFSLNNKFENRSLKEAFITGKKPPEINHKTSVSPFNYYERGIYASFLKKYYNYFDKEKIKILIFEKFVNNLEEINKLYDFLDVKKFIPHNYKVSYNKGNYSETGELREIKAFLADRYDYHNNELARLLKINCMW